MTSSAPTTEIVRCSACGHRVDIPLPPCCTLCDAPLLEKGAEVNAVDETGLSALHYAAYKNRLEIARALVTKGADPMLKSKQDQTPYDLALRDGHQEVAEYLLKQMKTGKK
jgi:ankyrin repeat protein